MDSVDRKFLDDVERLCPHIENETELIAERERLMAKPDLNADDGARLHELIDIVGPSSWYDDARALLRKAAAELMDQ
jgi:hypothetical protein